MKCFGRLHEFRHRIKQIVKEKEAKKIRDLEEKKLQKEAQTKILAEEMFRNNEKYSE